jgi:cobalt-zinc-cadmium efflux system membrane fusion protein
MAARDRSRGNPAALGLPRIVRFDSAAAVDAAGIDITPVWTAALTESVAGSGELQFDPARYTRVTARAAGTVWRVFKQMGDPVRAGELLALVDSADVGKAKAELQTALAQVKVRARAARDLASAPVNERQRTEAEAALREAEVRLLAAEQSLINLGLPPRTNELRGLSPTAVADRLYRLGLPADLREAPGTLLPVPAPMDGVILRTGAVAGEPMDASKVLFQIADPRQLRLALHVPAGDARWVKVGQEARFRPDSGPAEAVGRVTWVGATANEHSRTIPVWAEVPNPAGELRASTLGTGRVVIREEPDAVLVPADAVHTVAGTAVVFVRDQRYLSEDGLKAFHVRAVIVGARDGNNVEVIAGVVPGEVVATKRSSALAEALRAEMVEGTNRHE